MFSPTTTKKSFMQIFQHLQTQKTQALCGAATGATILNAMRVEAPADPWYFAAFQPFFTFYNFFMKIFSFLFLFHIHLTAHLFIFKLYNSTHSPACATRFFPYNYYTQETFFSSCVQNEISMATVLFQGMTLDELTKVRKDQLLWN